jgi:hypothetical protein
MVRLYWESKTETINTPEDRARDAKQQKIDLRFVYKYPGADVSQFKLKSLNNSQYFHLER